MPLSRRLTTASAFETLPVAAFLLELDGTILAVNRATCRISGRDADALIGITIQVLAPDLAPRWSALVNTAANHGQAVDETRLDGPTGTRDLQVVVGIADVDSRPILQAIAIDITERKAEEEAARQRAAAEQQTAAIQRLESLGVVAGGIAHDFNNLLVGVLAEASAAREDEALPATAHEALRRIEAAGRRMAQLTRQLLAFSGRAQLVTVALDGDALLADLEDQLTHTIRPGVLLEVTTGASGAVVEADLGLLRQVVVNLVTNASDAGARRIQLASRVMLHDGEAFWQFEVADDGAGIDATTLARIFEPFFTTKPDHHGLGLSAVHGIVRRLGGDVEVESRSGNGARFRVRLPIVHDTEPERSRMSEPHGFPALKLAHIRVLVADDEPSVRATVRRLLERRGATVVVAVDGSEAAARLRAEPFGLVVVDVQMPGLTGHDVVVVARETQPATPVVLMSGYTEKLRGEGSEEEADAFLEKPFTAKHLDAVIDRVLKLR